MPHNAPYNALYDLLNNKHYNTYQFRKYDALKYITRKPFQILIFMNRYNALCINALNKVLNL